MLCHLICVPGLLFAASVSTGELLCGDYKDLRTLLRLLADLNGGGMVVLILVTKRVLLLMSRVTGF